MGAPPTQQDRGGGAPPKRRRRGRDFDGRTREARRWRSLFAGYRAVLPDGAPTVAQDARLRSLATVTLRLDRIAADGAAGSHVDDAELVALANLQGRLMEALGLAAAPPGPPEPPDPDAHLTKIRDPEYWRRKREAAA